MIRFRIIVVAIICITAMAFQTKAGVIVCTTVCHHGTVCMQNATPEQRADAQTAMMKNKLKLDSGQVSKVKAINLKYALKFEPIIKSSASKMSRFKESKSLMTAKDAVLKSIFTSSQYKQYNDLKAEMRAKFKEMYNGAK